MEKGTGEDLCGQCSKQLGASRYACDKCPSLFLCSLICSMKHGNSKHPQRENAQKARPRSSSTSRSPPTTRTENSRRIFDAILREDFIALMDLVDREKFDVNALDEEENEFSPLYAACQTGNLRIINFLFERGAVVVVHNAGVQPMEIACARGSVQVVDILLKHGDDVNRPDKRGNTPLFYACNFARLDLVSFLLSHGARVNDAALLAAVNSVRNDDFEEERTQIIDVWSRRHEVICMLFEFAKSQQLEFSDECLAKASRMARRSKQVIIATLLENAIKSQSILLSSKKSTLELFVACEDGDLQAVVQSLDQGARIDASFEDGETPLFVACSYAFADIAHVLLTRGANPNAGTGTLCPIIAACTSLPTEVLRELQVDDDGKFWSRRFDILTDLLLHKADFEVKDENRQTALDHARRGKQQKFVDALLNAQAAKSASSSTSPSFPSPSSSPSPSPSSSSSSSSSFSSSSSISSTSNDPYNACGNCKKELTSSVKMTCSRCHTQRYCTADCQKSHWKVHKKICVSITKEEAEAAAVAAAQQARQKKALSDFWLACKTVDLPVLESLINEGDVEGIDLSSADVSARVFLTVMDQGNVQIATFFLEHGFPVNCLLADEREKLTILFHVVARCRVEMVRLLLSKGADVNLGTISPLYILVAKKSRMEGKMKGDVQAQDYEERRLAIANLLLDAGADVVAKIPEKNQCILDFALERKEVINFKLVAVLSKDRGGGGEAERAKSALRNTLLTCAFMENKLDRMALMLEFGADVDATMDTRDKQPLLAYAAAKANTDAVVLLLEHNANVNAADKHGHSALHFVCYSNEESSNDDALCNRKLDIVHKLLAAGADFGLRDENGDTPVDFALDNRNSHHRSLFVSAIMQHKYQAASFVSPPACKACGGSSNDCGMCQERKSLHKDLMWNTFVSSKDEEKSLEFVVELLEYISVFEGGGDDDKARPIDEAANVYSDVGRFPLWFAAVANHIKMAHQLLACGAHVDAQTKSSSESKRETSLVAAAQANHWDMVDLLLKHRANVNLDKRCTVLGFACLYGNFKFVQKLVQEHNADVSIGTPSPLYQALYMLCDDVCIAGKTSEERAALGITSELMSTEGGFFANKELIVRFLLKNGAFIDPPPSNVVTTLEPLPTLVSIVGKKEKFLSVIAVAQKIRDKHGRPLFLTLLLDEFNMRKRKEESEGGGGAGEV